MRSLVTQRLLLDELDTAVCTTHIDVRSTHSNIGHTESGHQTTTNGRSCRMIEKCVLLVQRAELGLELQRVHIEGLKEQNKTHHTNHQIMQKREACKKLCATTPLP